MFVTDFESMFQRQKDNQQTLIDIGTYNAYKSSDIIDIPQDDVGLCSYHVQQLMSEIGELLEADKRWKNFRNKQFDKLAKKEEIADCFIVLMNIAMFSGIDGEEMQRAIRTQPDTHNYRSHFRTVSHLYPLWNARCSVHVPQIK